jgi:TrmH family RNA methyltransferase
MGTTSKSDIRFDYCQTSLYKIECVASFLFPSIRTEQPMIITEKLTSRDNQRLKHAKRVRDAKTDGLMFVEGLRLCEEALRSGVRARECFVTAKFAETERGKALLKEAASAATPIFELSENLFESIAETKSPQGVIMICDRPADAAIDLAPDRRKLPVIVFLNEVNNPSNLGAIMRVAEAAGAAGIITTPGSADAYSPKVLRASAGSAFRLRIQQNKTFETVIEWARKNALNVTATAGSGRLEYTAVDWRRPRLLIFGSEGHGLTVEQMSSVADRVRIPMEGSVESLNLAVACGVLLFEAKRQCDL